MSTIEPMSASAHGRSAAQHHAERPAAAASAPAAPTQLKVAVQHSASTEKSRLMNERKAEAPPPARVALSATTQTAAYLTEMRLAQELADLREELGE